MPMVPRPVPIAFLDSRRTIASKSGIFLGIPANLAGLPRRMPSGSPRPDRIPEDRESSTESETATARNISIPTRPSARTTGGWPPSGRSFRVGRARGVVGVPFIGEAPMPQQAPARPEGRPPRTTPWHRAWTEKKGTKGWKRCHRVEVEGTTPWRGAGGRGGRGGSARAEPAAGGGARTVFDRQGVQGECGGRRRSPHRGSPDATASSRPIE